MSSVQQRNIMNLEEKILGSMPLVQSVHASVLEEEVLNKGVKSSWF